MLYESCPEQNLQKIRRTLMISIAAKAILTAIAAVALCCLLPGCGQSTAASNPVQASASSAQIPPADTAPAADITPSDSASILAQADADYHSHSWDKCIQEYELAHKTGLPPGPVSKHGSDGYAKHQVARANLYYALEDEASDDMYNAYQELYIAVALDPSDASAKRLLSQLKVQWALVEAQAKKPENWQNPLSPQEQERLRLAEASAWQSSSAPRYGSGSQSTPCDYDSKPWPPEMPLCNEYKDVGCSAQMSAYTVAKSNYEIALQLWKQNNKGCL